MSISVHFIPVFLLLGIVLGGTIAVRNPAQFYPQCVRLSGESITGGDLYWPEPWYAPETGTSPNPKQ